MATTSNYICRPKILYLSKFFFHCSYFDSGLKAILYGHLNIHENYFDPSTTFLIFNLIQQIYCLFTTSCLFNFIIISYTVMNFKSNLSKLYERALILNGSSSTKSISLQLQGLNQLSLAISLHTVGEIIDSLSPEILIVIGFNTFYFYLN